MADTKPFIRESGSGTAVVCIHANDSSSAQWRELMDLLSPRHRVIAPDLYGSGKSVDWPSASEISLATRLSSLLRCCSRLAIPSHSSATHTEVPSHCWPPCRIRVEFARWHCMNQHSSRLWTLRHQRRMVQTAFATRSTQLRHPWTQAIPTALQCTSLTSGWEAEAGLQPRRRGSRRLRSQSSACAGGRMPCSPSRLL